MRLFALVPLFLVLAAPLAAADVPKPTGEDIVDSDHFAGHGRTTDNCSRPRGDHRLLLDFYVGGRKAVASRKATAPIFQLKDGSPIRAAEPSRRFCNVLQDRLQFEVRLADDAQYLR